MKSFVLSWFILLAGAGSTLAQESLGAIKGSVRDLRGNPVGGATVYAYDTARMAGGFIRLTTVSGSDGKFVLRRVPPGSYGVHAYKESEGYPDTFFAFFGTSNKKAWRTLHVLPAATVNVVLELGPKYARLKVSIRNELGVPVSGGLSFRKTGDSTPSYSVGVNGESELLVPPVAFRFEVSANGYQTWQSKLLNLRSGETLEVTVRLIRSQK